MGSVARLLYTTWAELPASLTATPSRLLQQAHLLPWLSAVDFWNRSELELEHSRAAKCHSGPAMTLTTKMNCCLNCLICRLSGLHGLVVRLVHVSGVSCFSHDAVRLVSGPRALLLSRAAMKFLNVSSFPVYGILSRSLGFVSDLPKQIPFFPRSVSSVESPSR